MEPYCENITMPYNLFPINSFETSTMAHNIEVHPHWHTEIEILFFVSGYANQQVNEFFFPVQSGDLVIIGKEQLHSTYSFGKSICKVLVMQFYSDKIFELGIHNKNISSHIHLGNEIIYKNPIKTTSIEGKLLLENIITIHNELKRKETAYENMVMASLYSFTGILSRGEMYTVSHSNPIKTRKVQAMLEKTFKFIDDSYSEDITLGKAALTSNLSITHFCRLFKKVTGMTFYDYLTFYRVNRAERMLNTSKKMAEIAFECGFGSVSSFIRSFKKYKKCVPSKFK
jgi:AraC-like DNA-binding protein